MGLVYLPTFSIKNPTIHVGIYTSPMDPMGLGTSKKESLNMIESQMPISIRTLNKKLWDVFFFSWEMWSVFVGGCFKNKICRR